MEAGWAGRMAALESENEWAAECSNTGCRAARLSSATSTDPIVGSS